MALRTSSGDVPISPILKSGSQEVSHSPIVLANGAWIPKLSADLGIYVPIYPVKGLTLIFEGLERLSSCAKSATIKKTSFESTLINKSPPPPSLASLLGSLNNPVYHDRVLFTNQSTQSLRVSAFFEYDGWSLQANPRMRNGLLERARLIYPEIFHDGGRCAVVSGLRPESSDGGVIIGQLPRLRNVFINGGGGGNGFSTAAGSATLVAEIVKAHVLTTSSRCDKRSRRLNSDSHESTDMINRSSTHGISNGTSSNNLNEKSSGNKNESIHSSTAEIESSSVDPRPSILSLLSTKFDLDALGPRNRVRYSPLFCRLCLWRWDDVHRRPT